MLHSHLQTELKIHFKGTVYFPLYAIFSNPNTTQTLLVQIRGTTMHIFMHKNVKLQNCNYTFIQAKRFRLQTLEVFCFSFIRLNHYLNEETLFILNFCYKSSAFN